MAKGNQIIVSNNPRGVFTEGIISGTPKPGTLMERVPATEPDGNNRFTYRAYQPGTDGNQRQILVLLEDETNGRTATTAYVTGDSCKMYTPVAGEYLNMLVADVAGTADDIAIGDLFIADTGTGKLNATTGTPESEPFEALETVTDPTADQLVWMAYTGY